ncbi:MAG TPA: complex I NDUFA9 subunit family protein [Gemmatimonadaceae bacterium]|nr:complex I NDUFA9 subunit family protein [Gemmatimonadaceae bacterium]
MRVLVTGGTGVVGNAAVTALLERGHEVRLLSRHAARDARRWSSGVEPSPGNVTEPASLRGAADGCDAVLHLVGVVAERPPKATLEGVNVEGTRNIVAEAERAGVRKFTFVSSLGAERGTSPYHRSKYRAEQIVRAFRGGWVILRPGNVYGPGDDEISLLLKMVRALPAIPVIGDGDQPFQPIWHEDLGAALARAVERDDLHRRVLELAGPERTTQTDLLDRLTALTGREPARVPLPALLAAIGTRVAAAVGVEVPFNESQLTMLREGSVIEDPAHNALTAVFGIEPTSLDEGLARLADEQPEQLPGQGVGRLRRKQFWADITGSPDTPEMLIDRLRRQFAEIMPIEVGSEPGAQIVPERGATITMSLPVRGNIQVRVAECGEHVLTLLTVEGHPLAGAVRFLAEERGDLLRFEVQTYDRPSSISDYLVMSTIGNLLQDLNWAAVVEHMVEAAGGRAAEGVQRDSEALDEEQTERIERWLEELAAALSRDERDVRRSLRSDAAHESGDSPTELRP